VIDSIRGLCLGIPIHIRAVGAGGFWGEPAGEGGVVVAEGEVVEAGVGVVDLAGVGEDGFGAAAVVAGAVGAVFPGAGEGFVLQPQLARGAVGVLEEVAVGAGGGESRDSPGSLAFARFAGDSPWFPAWIERRRKAGTVPAALAFARFAGNSPWFPAWIEWRRKAGTVPNGT